MAWDVLGLALSVIPPVPVVYVRRTGTTVDAMGYTVPVYASPVTINQAHVQGVKTSVIEHLGLQVGKNYRLVHIAANALSAANSTLKGGDRLEFYGKKWVLVHVSPHYEEDGWNKLIVCEDKDYSDAITDNSNTTSATADAIS